MIDKNGSLKVTRRSKGRVKIADSVLQKPFNLRVRSIGFKFEVRLDCERILAEHHPQQYSTMMTLSIISGGVFTGNKPALTGTTTLFVTGPQDN